MLFYKKTHLSKHVFGRFLKHFCFVVFMTGGLENVISTVLEKVVDFSFMNLLLED